MRVRPLARREERTDLPPRVAIRARKPCFLARLRLLGWNVRLVVIGTPCSSLAGKWQGHSSFGGAGVTV